ncbi:hypothetical protein HPO96_36290 [Kribbella sandramycini]|uniref:Uncharacterized protein n=1 Tax=Kribbella sandramycini TaxID=60450 RepID=A0A7Y4L7F8_9ACTN|nr:hypothetical protein [Kribbella sandramycini]MBB6570157.1 hypothetical protein [Kribbella sandramycini]NOL45718.1 hypothetical protein [Kribbella sandramycini]
MLVVLGVMVVALVIIWSQRKRAAEAEVNRLLRSGGLPADAELCESARLWFVRRQDIVVLGVLAGVVVTTVGLLVADLGFGADLVTGGELDLRLLTLLFAFVAALGGVATLVHGYRAVRLSRVEGARQAALRPRRLDDYLNPIEVFAHRVIVVVPLVCVGLGVVVLGSADRPARGWILIGSGVLAVLLWAGGVWLQRMALGVSQASGRPEQLLWQEALRAATLRDLGSAMIAVCWLLGAAVPSSFEWPADVPAAFEWVGFAMFLVSMGLICVTTAVAVSRWGLGRVRRVVG